MKRPAWRRPVSWARPIRAILSVCLEPRPELAACVGRRPVMVTGGNTPVEGLPGERSCGDLDPSVVLKLAHDTHWGPEEASRILTQESGLRGLAGRVVSLADVLQSRATICSWRRRSFCTVCCAPAEPASPRWAVWMRLLIRAVMRVRTGAPRLAQPRVWHEQPAATPRISFPRAPSSSTCGTSSA